MYIYMWHVYLYIYLVCNSSYQLSCSQRNQYRSQWRSNKARADLLQLYRLDLAPRIRWTCFCLLPLLLSIFFLSFPELFVPVSCSYAQLQEIHCWYGRTFVKIDEYCHLTMSYDNSKTWLEWQSSCPQRKDNWGADLWARRFLDDEILPMLAEAANEGLVEAQLWSSSGFICPFPGLQPSWQEHIDAGMFMNRFLGTWTLGCWEADINCYHDSEIVATAI